MQRAVLLGHPVGHSLSPVMHDAAFAAAGLEASYEAWDVPPETLAAAVGRLRSGEVLGANVTVPHKTAVMAHLDAVSERASAIGAVNVIRPGGGGLHGDNSDAEGFLRSLREAGHDPGGRRVVLLGAGGAARSVAWGLIDAGVVELGIVNRSPDAAEALAAALRARAGERVRLWTAGREALARGVDAEWWINATSVGMLRGGVDPDESPVPAAAWSEFEARHAEGAWPEAPLAVDLVYRPRDTRFLRDARAAGVPTLSGLGMLLHQGAVAFEAWTGRAAPVAAMRTALEAALAGERGG